jgi:hypothetical protein
MIMRFLQIALPMTTRLLGKAQHFTSRKWNVEIVGFTIYCTPITQHVSHESTATLRSSWEWERVKLTTAKTRRIIHTCLKRHVI